MTKTHTSDNPRDYMSKLAIKEKICHRIRKGAPEGIQYTTMLTCMLLWSQNSFHEFPKTRTDARVYLVEPAPDVVRITPISKAELKWAYCVNGPFHMPI